VKRYPLFLDLTGQKVVVIGAGQVATRKIRTLLAAGALVTVISPEATPAIRRLGCSGGFAEDRVSQTRLASRRPLPAGKQPTLHRSAATPEKYSRSSGNRLRLLLRPYRQGDLAGARLVIAATNDLRLNERVCRDAKRRGLLVNCIAPPAAGNFIVPALVRRGGITLAISTGGASPAFAKSLRLELERFLTPDYVARLKRMARARRHD
jgi:precorrin-2 dehydrogenase/sirohydrochlorin ferrochelatase